MVVLVRDKAKGNGKGLVSSAAAAHSSLVKYPFLLWLWPFVILVLPMNYKQISEVRNDKKKNKKKKRHKQWGKYKPYV